MATWASSVVLSLAVASTLSFPRPHEYKIPDVGQGSRAQYYILHSDGTYKYGYDSGDGTYEQAMAQAPGEVSGAFGYKDPTGANIKLEYTADDRGFIPHGVHHPAHPENQFGLRLNETPSVDIRAATPHTQRMAVESNATSNEAVTVESNATSDEAVTVASNATSNNAVSPANVPAEPALIQSSAGDDGSYSFSYKTASSSRSESADAQNSVTGKYSIVGDDGINHGISYTAGSETGYIAEGDSLPRGPVVPGAESGIPTGRILPVLSEDEANGLATDIVAPQTSIVSSGVDVSGSGASGEASVTAKLAVPSEETHTAGATEAAGENHVADDTVPIKEPHTFSVKDDTVPIQDSYRSSVPGDGSYSFSYHTSSSSRSESSDAHNSLTGHYSFISEDGVNRNFNYTAGSETGYIVDGDSLPIGPSVPGAESGKPTGQILPVLSEEEANALASDTSHIASQTPLASSSVTNQTPSVSHPENQFGLRIKETPSVDIRAETPHTQHMAVESYATSNEAVTVASSATSNDAVSPANVPAEPAIIQSSAGDDGSYSFSYKTASSSRSESADAQNSVTGKYSIVGDDGINHGISYTAGSETGYIAEGDSLPRGPVVPGAESGIPTGRILPVLSEDEANGLATDIVAPQTSIVSSGVDISGSGASGEASVTAKLAVPSEETHTAGATEAAGENHVADDTVPIKEPHTISVKDDTVPIQDSYRSSVPGDGSYSFSYHTSSSSRSESSDAHNSLTGQYSFISKDGINRNFNYTAGSETGYIVDGDSLPIGPPVPGAESGKPTGQILPVLSEEEANALASDTSHLASQTPLASSSVTDQAPSKSQRARDDTDTNSVQNGSSSDASYFFRYDVGDSARSEIADKDLNIKGNYRFDVPGGKRYTVRYIAGSDIGFVVNVSEESPPSGVIIQSDSTFAPPKEVPATTEDVASSEESNVQSVTSCNDAVPADDNDDTASTEEPDIPDAKVPKPNEESYVSSFPGDGSYSFSYHTSDSSRFESADAYNSVTGQYSFTADDGINRKINYTAGSETGFITEGDSLPVGPSVPGAENGIPTGRIRPILSKEESNTLGSVHNAGYTDPILKSKENPNAVEKANPDRNIAGYYTSVDQNGTEHRIIHIAGQDTNSIPRGYLSPNPKKDAADATTAHSGTLVHSAPSAGESQSNGGGSSSTTSPPEHPKSSPAAPTESLSNGHSSRIVGDVLLHQYDPANRDKYGYAYTAVN